MNYSGIEGDKDVAKELDRLSDAKYVRAFQSKEKAREFLNADPVLSKMSVIERIRAGVVKKRIVLDTKASGVSSTSSKSERSTLPRATDAAFL